MKRASTYRAVDRAYFCSANDQVGPGALWVGRFLAVSCLFFGAVFVAFVPASLEQRIGSLFLFGFIPAAGFYAGGHLLSQLLVLGRTLCEMIAARCFRCLARLKNNFVIWVSPPASDASIGCQTALARCLLSNASALSEKAYRSIRHHCWRVHVAFIDFGPRPFIMTGMLLTAFGLGWCAGNSVWLLDLGRDDLTGGAAIDLVVERIIVIESDGDPNVKNKRSSATGLGQFIDETWLDLIRTHRPDLARDRGQDKALELRRDPKVAREITMRFTQQNAGVLRKRGLPVTPGTLYLAHFAGGAGAVAILSAREDADAASVMADAGRTKREKIVRANPFLERFSVADLRSWANRKMR